MYSEIVKNVLPDSRKFLHIHPPSLISLQKQMVREWQLPKTGSKAGQKVRKLRMKEDQLASAACCTTKQHGNVPLSLGLHPIPPLLFSELNFKNQLKISSSRPTASEGWRQHQTDTNVHKHHQLLLGDEGRRPPATPGHAGQRQRDEWTRKMPVKYGLVGKGIIEDGNLVANRGQE